ncbi:sarcosine oxidase subunit gamma [Sphingopyxis sp. JAI128]|uniref:sarcosine oxidase subunit gamma n=1 Tax=Sphingopyxis sp. JAI128 TaxID=2723066 RepID=UPI001615572A|nr:sarcosine oxidase subunit gamma family protein [Sphingopyxis sp. JAI128]MBB6427885.1 sarcosine oxidase subunit gamma [Sphingopyxis sp. JAI128]
MFESRIASPFAGESDAIASLGPIGRAVLRCREADIGSISDKLGIALPRAACRSESNGPSSALWLGPDEWLLLHADLQDDWVSRLAAHLEGELCSLVDVSHRQVALAVQGARAAEILASGCALDLSPRAFPVGMCTRTMFARAEVVLWRTGSMSFHLDVWRSFARYVEALLREAESEN